MLLSTLDTCDIRNDSILTTFVAIDMAVPVADSIDNGSMIS